jgi:hypothetical protein
MTPTQNYVLFTAADAIYAFVPTRKDFEYRLLINLLFEEKLMMHEGYIINSPFLAEHIRYNARGRSLFEIAAENALIIPAYRQEGTVTLLEAVSIMEAAHSKKTILHLSTEEKTTRYRLSECLYKGQQVFYWPNEKLSMGESYQNLLFDKLRNESSVTKACNPQVESAHEYYWEKTETWRTRLLDEAAAATLARGQSGIQRAEIFRLLAEDLEVEDVQKMQETHERYYTAQVFLRWINHCHQLNTASFFGAAPYLINYNLAEDFIVADFFSGTTGSSSDGAEPLRETVNFPKWEILLKRIQDKPHHFIGLRFGIGKDYLHSLKIWRANPTFRNRDELLINFKEYCKALCKDYLKESECNLLTVVVMDVLNILNPIIPFAENQVGGNILTKILGSLYKITNLTKTDVHIYHPLNKLNSE